MDYTFKLGFKSCDLLSIPKISKENEKAKVFNVHCITSYPFRTSL